VTYQTRGLLILAIVTAGGCGGAWTAEPPPTDDVPNTGERKDVAPLGDPDGPAPGATGTATPGQPAGATSKDAAEISRSVGEKGGVVLFWPRVIPRTDDPAISKLAGELQTKLATLVQQAVPGGKLDQRPEPERVCPRDGCAAMTVGVLLVHHKGGCSALGLISGPGTAEQQIVPWAGVVELAQERVPFRDPPENKVTIRDAVPCKDLLGKLGERDGEIVKAIGATAKR